ncbi:selenoprotein K isoform X3 [Tursiops truncatus]|uniref:selenoprotein K isoform X3 n=1 Tax=Tursiops truncatus TaxID=9739 RepID=UPI003CCF48D1
MVYISNGQVLDSRSQSPWRLSFITDFFWGIAEFVVLLGLALGMIVGGGRQRRLFQFQNSVSARCEKEKRLRKLI